MPYVSACLAILALLYILFRVAFRRHSTIERVPGPPSPSWIYGTLQIETHVKDLGSTRCAGVDGLGSWGCSGARGGQRENILIGALGGRGACNDNVVPGRVKGTFIASAPRITISTSWMNRLQGAWRRTTGAPTALLTCERDPEWMRVNLAESCRMLEERGIKVPLIVAKGYDHVSITFALGTGQGEGWVEDVVRRNKVELSGVNGHFDSVTAIAAQELCRKPNNDVKNDAHYVGTWLCCATAPGGYVMQQPPFWHIEWTGNYITNLVTKITLLYAQSYDLCSETTTHRVSLNSEVIGIESAVFTFSSFSFVKRGGTERRVTKCPEKVVKPLFRGLKRWHLKLIIQFLPVLIHIAFFLFSIGLVILVFQDDVAIGIVIFILTALIMFLYIRSSVHSAYLVDSPFRTPLSGMIRRLRSGSWRLEAFAEFPSRKDAQKAQALTWLLTESPNADTINAAICAVAGLPANLFVQGPATPWLDIQAVLMDADDTDSSKALWALIDHGDPLNQYAANRNEVQAELVNVVTSEGYLTDSIAKFGTPTLLEGLTSGSMELQRRYVELFTELTQNYLSSDGTHPGIYDSRKVIKDGFHAIIRSPLSQKPRILCDIVQFLAGVARHGKVNSE
ncbi:hypothetical protein B0H14DRAFT_2621913 [Mycena olivaceomarginata]|nr:hypothetical protein B0H14DRAFT_2621913 [Mycena olivaceomarginata]